MHTVLDVLKPGNLHPLFRKKQNNKKLRALKEITWQIMHRTSSHEGKGKQLLCHSGLEGQERKWLILSAETSCTCEMCSTVCKLCYVVFGWCSMVLARKAKKSVHVNWWKRNDNNFQVKSTGNQLVMHISMKWSQTVCRNIAIPVISLWKCYQILHQGLA